MQAKYVVPWITAFLAVDYLPLDRMPSTAFVSASIWVFLTKTAKGQFLPKTLGCCPINPQF
ncbi:MAG: hypothetical protein DM484_01915 [Candidatus Methylumidiphilus alinenensis]|uniref:Uncharacterized protein n=1 Tax=Candidatus Methylumidiphilus alinenensis TaxID=2202197 RepID=A0A2W4RM77_9GAMM|nr:MAG: hypothetical protein DM484_01915 [Candidatus Methylumidiphilus alinenensis]